MPRKKENTLDLFQARTSTAPCVPNIRVAVDDWRNGGYKGVSGTTRTLLNFWFHSDHVLHSGEKFAYSKAQKEAIETLIYLWEIARVRSQSGLMETFCARQDLKLLQYDDFARYCLKMATGSGKTFVMALAIAYHYLNSTEKPDEFARTFLLLAPNVIVYERLKQDFEAGRVFRFFPVIPRELQIFWNDFQVYTRGEGERADSDGALYLTNIQQLYERAEKKTAEPDALTAVLGTLPPTQDESRGFLYRLKERGGPLCVLNDEAHHTHDEKLGWNEVIRELHDNASGSVLSQLDFTATPRHSKGNLFAWTIYDYPLKQAMIDGLVKIPVKGLTSGIREQQSEIASTRYAAYLTAGVERWREYKRELEPLGKKPVLFVMLNDTSEADDVGDFLRRRYPNEFGDKKLLVIHTDRSGEVSKKDLDEARELARRVDEADNPVNCIVSVLMLREGWDVQNVTVVVGLRPYSSTAKILPEQAIGRGLRLMFRNMGGAYKERVDVIGNAKFIEFVDDLEKEEDITLQTFEVGKDKLHIETIRPLEEKTGKDILMPELTPILERKKSLEAEILALDVTQFSNPPLPLKAGSMEAQNFRYEGYDILTMEKLVERDYQIPEVQTAEEVIGYYAKHIMQDVKLPSQFSIIAPKVRQFLEHKLFGNSVDLSDKSIIKSLGSNAARFITLREFTKALRPLVVIEVEPQLSSEGRKLSETPAFPWARPMLEASKCIYSQVACDNEFEKRFAKFLEDAKDIERFAKLPSIFAFVIKYTDAVGNLRNYEPDFVAVDFDGTHFLIETKGMEDVNVTLKDQAARLWCDNATELTGTLWRYLKVPQNDFNKLQPGDFEDVVTAF